jgi:UDP-2-acetamido-3-amino-2,3-dideoxy-glucuronate N-acetyltransferase
MMISEHAKLHPLADVASCHIGSGTRVWQFVVILAGARIGADCNVCANVLIEGDVQIGDRVTIKSGVQLWDGLRIKDDVFIGPNATFANDPFPRSGARAKAFVGTWIERGASIGAGAVILPGVTIGAGAMVAAGAVVTNDVEPRSLVMGVPARRVRWLTEAEVGG